MTQTPSGAGGNPEADGDHGTAAAEDAAAAPVPPRSAQASEVIGALAIRLSRHVSAYTALIVSTAIGLTIAVLLTRAAAEIYEGVKASNGLSTLDEPVLYAAVSLRTPASVGVAQVLTNLGGAIGLTIITATIVLIMTIRWRSWSPLFLVGIGVSGSLLMTAVGKNLTDRARPPQTYAVPPYETSLSFPSGHALNNTVVACLVGYLLLQHLTSRLARILTVALAAIWAHTIGVTRVFLGYHWLTDVMAGWTLGLAWSIFVITCYRLFRAVRQARQARFRRLSDRSPLPEERR